MRGKAQICYAEQLQAQISKEIPAESVPVDFKIRIHKPIHVKWVTQYYDKIRTDEDIVQNGWRRSGISKAIKKTKIKIKWKLDYTRSIFV